MTALELWLAAQSPAVQAAAKRWPLGTAIEQGADVWYLVGWSERRTDGRIALRFSPLDPTDVTSTDDNDLAMYVWAEDAPNFVH